MPARVRQARDKALVENAVRLAYQRIYAPLRDRTFHSLDELNAAIRDRSGSRFSSPGSGYPDSGCGGEFIRTSTWSHDGIRNSRNVARTAPQNSRRDPNPARTC